MRVLKGTPLFEILDAMPKKPKGSVKKTQISRSQIFWTLLVLAAIFGLLCIIKTLKHTPPTSFSVTVVPTPTPTFDFGNHTYLLDGNSLTFKGDKYSSNDGSVNADIQNTTLSTTGNLAASILVANFGGSGTFYYLVGVTKQNSQEIYSLPVSLGDRIIISSVSVEDATAHDNGEIIVEYLDRAPSAPMSADPTIKTTAKFAFEENGNLISVIK